jgi:hypothetical protein
LITVGTEVSREYFLNDDWVPATSLSLYFFLESETALEGRGKERTEVPFQIFKDILLPEDISRESKTNYLMRL